MSKGARKETKKCRICGKSFSEQSKFGNPYKWCPVCRDKKRYEFEKLAKKVNNK